MRAEHARSVEFEAAQAKAAVLMQGNVQSVQEAALKLKEAEGWDAVRPPLQLAVRSVPTSLTTDIELFVDSWSGPAPPLRNIRL
jgi:hypothetical protein